MPPDDASLTILQIDEGVSIELGSDGGLVSTPSGIHLRVGTLELTALLEFQNPRSVARVHAMVGKELQSALIGKVKEWLDCGVLRIARNTHGSKPTVAMVNAKSRRLFFVYAGTQGGVMMSPLEFLRESGLANQNVVLLRDPSQAWFLKGISDRIGSFAELVAWQSGFREGVTHVESVFCVGSSMGAFAAIVFGHALHAKTVWSFGLSRTSVPVLNSEGQAWDLELLLREWNGVSRYCLFFNESWSRDREAAMRLKDLPGVELWPQKGDGHLVLRYLLEIGALPNVFSSAFEGTYSGGTVANRAVTETSVLRVLRTVLPQCDTELDVTTNLAGILDSFALVQLLEELESQFGVILDPDRLSPADFETAAAVTHAIARESQRPAPLPQNR
jgi:acyl carrier protein